MDSLKKSGALFNKKKIELVAINKIELLGRIYIIVMSRDK